MSAETKALAPVDEVRRSLTQMKDQFKMVLPPQVDVDRFTRVAMTAVQNDPKLLKANRHSLYSATMKCAQSGLIPDGRLAALVPFGDDVAFMPMIAGILQQIRNSGELSSILAEVVYKGDKFRYWIDADGPHLEHEPNLFGDRGEAIAVYGIGKTKDGGIYIEVMTTAQVMDVRNVSRSKNGPWEGAFKFEMWRKTVLKRLAKRMPMSTDLEGLMKADDDLFMPPVTDVVAEAPPEPSKKASKTSRLVNEAVGKSSAAINQSSMDQRPDFITDAGKAEPKPVTEPKPVYNHAPGASNPPPPPAGNEASPI
jgi:recombination protein RecT